MIVSDVPPKPVAHESTCHTHKCWQRVHNKRVLKLKWKHIKQNPMPSCTWVPESSWDPATGENFYGKPWHPRRYRVKNPNSTAGGKFQILNTTWYANSKWRPKFQTSYPAAAAPRLEQEYTARRILRRGGLSQWARC